MKLLNVVFLIYFADEARSIMDADLIIEYFKHKSVDYGSVYGCFRKKEQVVLAKALVANNLSLSLYNIKESTFNINQTYVFIKNNGHLGIALDGNCEYARDFLEQSSLCEVFTDVHHWLVFLQQDTIETVFKDIVMTVSTDLKVAVPYYQNGSVANWLLYDVYNQAGAHGGSLKTGFYNVYEYPKPLVNWKKKESLYWVRRNMTGVLFQTMVVLPKDFPGKLKDYLVNDDDREVNTFNRFHTVLVYHIKDFYNFTMNISLTKSWGYKMHNSTFDGLVRALEDRVVDFGLSPLFVKDERWPVVDYGRRTWLLKSAFIFRMPKRPASFEVFLRPLDGRVWYVTMAAVIVIVVILRLSMKVEFAYLKNVVLSFESTWSFLFMFTFGAICQQGAAETPNSICSRILVIYVFVFAVLLYQFYSASIVSILLMTPARIIKNLQDLAFSTLTLGVEDVLYNQDYIGKLQFDPVVSRLEKKAPTKGNVSFYCDPEVGLPLVAKGGYAFHVEVATAYPIIQKTFDEDTICSLDEVQLFQTQQMHQPLQKHSPFREMMNHVLHKIDEAGLMDRQIKHWHAKKPECIRLRPPTSSVSLEDFYPALSILLIGMILSVTMLIIEHIIKHRDDRMNEQLMRKKMENAKKPMFPFNSQSQHN